MNINFVNNTNLIPDVSEEYLKTKKSKYYIYTKHHCENFFQKITGIIHEPNNNDFNLEFILNNECKDLFEYKRINILGEYYPKTKEIKYYKQNPEILEITEIHERFHAVHHLEKDKNGNIWKEYSCVSPFYQELLVQLFTYIYIRDNQPSLLNTFNNLNLTQPFIYQTFKIFKHYTFKEAEKLYWIIREQKKSKILEILERIEEYLSCIKKSSGTLDNEIKTNLTNVLSFIVKNPSVFVSETDIHQLVMTELTKIDVLNPMHHLYDTNCTIGEYKKGKASKEKYKTMLMHKEYGHRYLPKSRSDIVILNEESVACIDDPINLKWKGKWLIPDYIFEFGTEKSASSKKVFKEHLENDFKKIAYARKKGYLIHIHRNYIKSSTKTGRGKNNKIKFDDYLTIYKKVYDDVFLKYKPCIDKLKVIIIIVNIGSDSKNLHSKITLFTNPLSNPILKSINLNTIHTEIEKLL